MNIFLQSDSTLFFGRFHSLVVHLPIGFLILGVVFYGLSFFRRYQFLRMSIPLILLLGGISGLVSVIFGFLLAEEGGYPSVTLFWHRWLGFMVVVGSFSLYFWWKKEVSSIDSSTFSISTRNKSSLGLLSLVMIVSITGHLGGTLTHGENYLVEYAPSFFSKWMNVEEGSSTGGELPFDSDSTMIFEHLLGPVIRNKCESCHNKEDKKGGLDLTSLEGMVAGGENGPVIENGSPHQSELFRRVTLDPSSKKYMPPKGEPLSYAEISLLSFWIGKGMPQNLAVTDDQVPGDIKSLLEETYQISTKKKPYYEKVQVGPASEDLVKSIRALGFSVDALSEENNFLEVIARGKLTPEKLQSLEPIGKQITWLDLGEAGLEDSWLDILGQFPNLTRLNLDNNPISNKGIGPLTKLEHLEAVNLFNTGVGDSGLIALITPKGPKRIYLWNSQVTSSTIDSLVKANPGLLLDIGVIEDSLNASKGNQ